MSKRTLIIAATGALLMAGAAVAISAPGDRGGHGWGGHGRGGHHGGMMHGGGDHEGMRGRFGMPLTKEAFDTRMRERFARFDRNSDNVIEPGEFEAALSEGRQRRMGRGGGEGRMGPRMLHRMGAGADGKLSREQFRAEITRRFGEMDLNSDGRIDDNDLPPMMRGRNALSEGGMGRGRGPGRWLRMLGVQATDGVITREAVLAAADRQFDRLDRNKDGTVDTADTEAIAKEMLAYRVQRMAHRMGAGPDGRVTREAFEAKAGERFARMDADGDGTISRGERGGRGWGGGHHGRGHHGGMGGGMRDGDATEGRGRGPGRDGGRGPDAPTEPGPRN